MQAISTPPTRPSTATAATLAATYTAHRYTERSDKTASDARWTRVDNRAINRAIRQPGGPDPDLSVTALGLLVAILSKPDGWRHVRRNWEASLAISRGDLRRAWDELRRAGYLTLTATKSPTGLLIKYWRVNEQPLRAPLPSEGTKPVRGRAIAGNDRIRSLPGNDRNRSDRIRQDIVTTECSNDSSIHPSTVRACEPPPIPPPPSQRVVVEDGPSRTGGPPAPTASATDGFASMVAAFGRVPDPQAMTMARKVYDHAPFEVKASDADLVRRHQTEPLDDQARRAGGAVLHFPRLVATWTDQVQRARAYCDRNPPPPPARQPRREDRPPGAIGTWRSIVRSLGYPERTSERDWHHLEPSTRSEVWDAYESGNLGLTGPPPSSVGLLDGFRAILAGAIATDDPASEVEGLAG